MRTMNWPQNRESESTPPNNTHYNSSFSFKVARLECTPKESNAAEIEVTQEPTDESAELYSKTPQKPDIPQRKSPSYPSYPISELDSSKPAHKSTPPILTKSPRTENRVTELTPTHSKHRNSSFSFKVARLEFKPNKNNATELKANPGASDKETGREKMLRMLRTH